VDEKVPPSLPEEKAGYPEEPSRDTLTPPRNLPSFALTGLFVLAVFYTLYFAKLILLPLVLALLCSLLLAPVMGGLRRLLIPDGIGAALVILAFIGAVAGSGYLLLDPAAAWLDRVPSDMARLEGKLSELRKPVDQVSRTTKEVERFAQMNDDPPVQVQQETLAHALLGGARTTIGGTAVFLVLLYFLLASGDMFLRKLIRVLTTLGDKKRAVEISRQLQEDISVYLLTITAINLGLGVAQGTAMHLLGMPNPLLWGAMATILNFIPYLGAMVGIVVIALAAAMSLETAPGIFLPPLVYFLITAAEGYFITPLVIGRRLTLNPVVILLGLVFWGWMWGIVGAILAVPLLVSFKILCDHIPRLSGVGEFLGR
jgi:predicted PurR-regulated permease PerM